MCTDAMYRIKRPSFGKKGLYQCSTLRPTKEIRACPSVFREGVQLNRGVGRGEPLKNSKVTHDLRNVKFKGLSSLSVDVGLLSRKEVH
jgi:hypothetical protein